MIIWQKRLDCDASVIKFSNSDCKTYCSLSVSNKNIFDAINNSSINTEQLIAYNANVALRISKSGAQQYELMLSNPHTNKCIGRVLYKNGIVFQNLQDMRKLKQIVELTATASNAACSKNTELVCAAKAMACNTTAASFKLGSYQALCENNILFSKIHSNHNSQASFNQTQALVMSALLFAVGMRGDHCTNKIMIANSQQAVNMDEDFWKALVSCEPCKHRASVVTKLANGSPCRKNFAVRWCEHDNLPVKLQAFVSDNCSNKEWCFIMGTQNNTAVAIAPCVMVKMCNLPIQLNQFFQDSSVV